MSTHRAAIYARISEDREGDRLGVDRQVEDCRKRAEALGWTVVETYVDNDISASTGKVRPEFRRMLEAVRAGHVDGVVAWQMDRLCRRTADLVTVLDVLEGAGAQLATVSGEVDPATAAGRLVLRLLGSVAEHEVELKSERQRRANRQRAEMGKPRAGGTRPFGYQAGGVKLDRAEAAEFRRIARRVLAGESLGSIVADLNARGITTTTGGPWSYAALRQVLRRPRNAGIVEHRGEVIGQGGWTPLVTVEQHESLMALLNDPGRRRSTSNRLKHWLAGAMTCGVEGCGAPVRSATAWDRYQGSRPIYRCSTGSHGGRNVQPIEDFIEDVMVARLSKPDVVLPDRDAGDVRVQDVALDLAAARARLGSLAVDFADGELTSAQLKAATGRLRAKIAELEGLIAASSAPSPLRGLTGSPAAAERFRDLLPAQKRAVLDELALVTLHPVGRGGGRVLGDGVEIEWKGEDA